MADGSGFFINNNNGGYSVRDGDLQEEDVWGVLKHISSEDPTQNVRKPSNPRLIPRVTTSHNHGTKMGVQQSSAPMDITDWSSVYRGKNSKAGSWVNNNGDHACYYNDYDDDGGDDDEMVPPHEYIAKKLARTQISSYSMCEGVGRTLKGRDLSKVRNAILTKTGFLE